MHRGIGARLRGALGLAALLIAAVPASAGAVTVSGTQGAYVFEVRDAAEPTVAGAGCSGGGAPETPVTCALKVLPALTVVLGNGGSLVDGRGLPVLPATSVTGGTGNDTILTANGDDQVQDENTKEDARDRALAVQNVRASGTGHQRSWTRPMMYFFGTRPQCRLSELLFR